MSSYYLIIRKIILSFLILPASVFASGENNHLPFNQKDTLLSGYSRDLGGEVLNYHSCHPAANTSLLIRCLNKDDFIEWETQAIPSAYTRDTLIFCWIGGYSTGTSSADHLFHFYVNGDEKLTFLTVPRMSQHDWKVKGKDDCSLEFMFVSEDHVQDHFGYFFLKIPRAKLLSPASLRLKIKGDASGSRDWYMTMRYSLNPRFELLPEEAILKGEGYQAFQRLKISLDHYTPEEEAEIQIDGVSTIKNLLHFGVNEFIVPVAPVNNIKDLVVDVISASHKLKYVIPIHPVRSYKVFILPHSHVDIGYTDIQPEIARIHAAHVKKAMQLIKASQNNPVGSRFKWNVEMLWEAESFLHTASAPEKQAFFEMVHSGSISLEGMYAGVMTGLCRDEELFHLFDYKLQLEHQHQLKINTAMITDIPGTVWGLIPVMAQSGIRYFSVGPNTGDRIGNTIKAWGDKPFWWVSPSGKEKVLTWMSSRGYSLFHKGSLAKTDGSQILEYLADLSKSNYPYDLVQLRYTVGGDNGYPDSLLADYVKDWNERYISPKLEIAVTEDMFKEFEEKYGSQIPSFQGDFSPYWEDGAASTAKETAMNRASAERIVQAGIQWAMNDPDSYPSDDFYTAWNNVILYSEHTWGAWNSTSDPDLQNVRDQWEIKKGFAESADLISKKLLEKSMNLIKGNEDVPEIITVFNTNNWVRNGLINIPANQVRKSFNCLTDASGHYSNGQLLSDGTMAFMLENVPALSKTEYHFSKPSENQTNKNSVSHTSLENEVLKVTIDSLTGEIISIIDKRNNKEWCSKKSGSGLNTYWYTGQNAINPVKSGKTVIKIKDQGPVVVTLQITSEAAGARKIVREISIYKGEAQVWITNIIDKTAVREKENVRFCFPFNITDPEIHMDMAWFVLEPGKNQMPGSNMNYFTAQRWLDISGLKDGVTIACPDAPLWETGKMTGEDWMKKEGNSWRTLPEISSTVYSWVMNNSWHTNFKADQEGEVTFRYVLCPHGMYNKVETIHVGADVSRPLHWISGRTKNERSKLPEILNDENIIITSIIPDKNIKGGFIYRFYNVSSSLRKYSPFNDSIRLKECNPDGKACSEEISRLEFNGNEIKTVKVYPAK